MPFGAPIDPIFDFIRRNDYTQIEPIVKAGYDLNTKLFDGGYVPGVLAMYYGNTQAVKKLQSDLVNEFRSLGADIVADYIKELEVSKLTINIQKAIDTLLDSTYGETFDKNAEDKANAIIELPIPDWISELLKLIAVDDRRAPAPAAGPRRRGGNKYVGGDKGACETDYPIVFNLLKQNKYKNSPLDPVKAITSILTDRREIVNLKNLLGDLEFENNPSWRKRKILGIEIFKLINSCHPDKNVGFEAEVNVITQILNNIKDLEVPADYVLPAIKSTDAERNMKFRNVPAPEPEVPPPPPEPAAPPPPPEPEVPPPPPEPEVPPPPPEPEVPPPPPEPEVPPPPPEPAAPPPEPEVPPAPEAGPRRIPVQTVSERRKNLKRKILDDDCKNADPNVIKDPIKLNKTKESVKRFLNEGVNREIKYKDDLGVEKKGKLLEVLFTKDEQTKIAEFIKKLTKLERKPREYLEYYKRLIKPFCEFISSLDGAVPPPAPEVPPAAKAPEVPKSQAEIKSYLNKFDSEKVKTLLSKAYSIYKVEKKVGGGGLIGGRYTGPKYETFKPSSTNPAPPVGEWYEISAKSLHSLTPLQYAAGYGSVDSVRVLIRNGAKFDISTLDGVSMRDFAASRPNESRKNEVVTLLEYVFKAFGTAYSDYNLKKMKDNYVNEVDVSGDLKDKLRKEDDLLNYVYTKTYKALKEGKPTTGTLSEAEEKAKKQGRTDALESNAEDEAYTKSPNKNIREAYKRGYVLGTAEKQGKVDGFNRIVTPRNIGLDPEDKDVRKAYLDAYNTARGRYVLQGFEDGIRGKPISVDTSTSSLGFDPEFSKFIQLQAIDPTIESEYLNGYNIGIRKFEEKIPTMVGNAQTDGTLDGVENKSKYSRKFTIKEKPMLGEGVDSSTLTEKEYEVNYGELDLTRFYEPKPSIRIDPEITDVPMRGPNIAYGTYIKILYDKGFEKGRRSKGGSHTYRRKRNSKTKTYKKKLSKK